MSLEVQIDYTWLKDFTFTNCCLPFWKGKNPYLPNEQTLGKANRLSQEGKRKVPTLACNHLALGEISFIILWMGTYGSRSNTLVMWGGCESEKKKCSMVCQFCLKTNCPEMWKYSWSIVSTFHCMNTLSDLSILLLMDIWVMSYYEIAGVFMYSGYKLFVRHICCKYFLPVYENLLIFKMMSARAKFEILLV